MSFPALIAESRRGIGVDYTAQTRAITVVEKSYGLVGHGALILRCREFTF